MIGDWYYKIETNLLELIQLKRVQPDTAGTIV